MTAKPKTVTLEIPENLEKFSKEVGLPVKTIMKDVADIFFVIPPQYFERMKKTGDARTTVVDLFGAAEVGWHIVDQISEALGLGSDFVIDDTETNLSDRRVWVLFRSRDEEKTGVDTVDIQVGSGGTAVTYDRIFMDLDKRRKDQIKEFIDKHADSIHEQFECLDSCENCEIKFEDDDEFQYLTLDIWCEELDEVCDVKSVSKLFDKVCANKT